MKRTVPARISKRKARDERLRDYDKLADYANLGDKPADWKRFRLRQPAFFPGNMTGWIYTNARFWSYLSNIPSKRPDNYQQILHWYLGESDATMTIEQWANFAKTCREKMPTLRPPLLLYRNLLRRLWRRQDPYGSCLRVLLGFEDCVPVHETAELQKEDDSVIEDKQGVFTIEGAPKFEPFFSWNMPKPPEEHVEGNLTWRDKETESSYGLPKGTPLVDGDTGTIIWEFDCDLQTWIYHLMPERRRAKVCGWKGCGKYFVAYKTAQKYCSPGCCGERKREQALKYYRRHGKAKRQQSKARRATPKSYS